MKKENQQDKAKVNKLTPDPKGVVVGVGEEGLMGVCRGAIEAKGYRLVSEGVGDVVVGFGIRGTEVTRLRRTTVWRHVPLVAVCRCKQWVEGADVVVRWPTSPQFVAAQVEAIHARTVVDRSVSTLTGLPGGRAIALEMNARLSERTAFYATYIDVNNFKPFNDAYGFERGDRVIEALSAKITDSVALLDGDDSFCGHVGGDDFVVVCSEDPSRAMRWLAFEFDRMIQSFYSKTDLLRKGIVALDREGSRKRYPLMSISVVTLRCGEGASGLSEVSQKLAGIKRRAKSEALAGEGSVYLSADEDSVQASSEHLLARLISSDSAPTFLRRAAMEAAGELRLGETAYSLYEVLGSSPDPMLRKSAAYALGRVSDRKSVSRLTAALQDLSPHVRMRAAEALGEIGDSRALRPLIERASDENRHVRSAAVRSLGRLGIQSAIEQLTRSVSDSSQEVRLSAVAALGSLGGPGVYDVLARHLEGCNTMMRRRIAEALGRTPDPACVAILIAMLDDDDNETVWRAAYSLYLLARSGMVPVDDANAVGPLSRMLSKKDGHLLRGAALALGGVAAPGTAGPVIPLLFDKRGFVRSSAAWALGKIGDRRAVGPLRAALRDGLSAVRFRAAGALGELGSKAAIEPLRVSLKDRNESVRQAAATAICMILEKLLAMGDVRGIGVHE